MPRWLRSRRLTVASVGAGRDFGGFCPRPLPVREEDWGPGIFCGVVGALGGAVVGRAWLHSGGSSPVYLVPLWALFSGLRSRMAWALLSSKVSPSG